jgi:hypothetical protein
MDSLGWVYPSLAAVLQMMDPLEMTGVESAALEAVSLKLFGRGGADSS